MTSRHHPLTYFLFVIHHLALLASVGGRPPGCDWLNNPDPNPGKPELNSTTYHASIAPDVPLGTVILTVSANDTDVNDTLWYFLEDCDYADFIDLDPSTGQLKVISTLMDIYALEIQCVIRVQDRENLTDSTIKADRADLVIKIYDIRDVVEDEGWPKSWWEDEFETKAPDDSKETTTPLISHDKNPDNQTPTVESILVPSYRPEITRTAMIDTTAPGNKTTTTQKPQVANTPVPSNKTITTQKPKQPSTPVPSNKTTTTQKPKLPSTPVPSNKTTTTQKPKLPSTPVPSNKTTTTQKPKLPSNPVPSNKTTTTQKPKLPSTPVPSNKTTTTQKPKLPSTPVPSNKTTTTQKPKLPSTPVPSNKTRTTQRPKPNVGKTTPTPVKPGKGPSGKETPVPNGGVAKRNRTRVVKKVKKPGNKDGEAAEYAYEYEYDYDYDYSKGEEGDYVSNKTQASGSGKGVASGNAKKKKKRVKVGGNQEIEEQSQEYGRLEDSVGGTKTIEEKSAGYRGTVTFGSGRDRDRKGQRVKGGHKKGRKHKGYNDATARSDTKKGNRHNGRQKHEDNSTSSEEIDYSGGYSRYSYNETGEENNGSYGRGYKGTSDKRRNGYKYKGGKRLKHGENSTSSEETDYSGGYNTYSYNETGEVNNGSYGRGYKGTSDKRRNGYKYKGGKRLKHGENSTSSEDIDYSGGYNTYSYNETGEENNGSYGRGYKGTSDKRRNGYKYKGGKRLKHGENSTSSEETDYSGGYNTYSYIETGEENNGSYGRGYKGTSDKRRNGYKYKGGKRLKHDENSTSSEDIDYSGGYSSYSYNETGKENGGSYGRGIKGKSDKRRNGYKYKGGKRLKHGENSTSSEQTNYSGGYYSYSYNETGEENNGNYGRGYKGTSDKRRNGYKYKGGKRLKHGENSTSSEDIDYSGGYYSHSYNETGEENGGSYGRGIKGTSDKRRNGYKYKGGKRLKHGENSTSSEQTNYSGGYYSYSYNETGEENNGSYGRGYKGTSDKRRNGYKYKGGKRLKHGENSTSSEDIDYSGGYYSHSYNETGEENGGSYGRGIKGTSDKRRNGYKYKGGKRLKHGENSTSSEQTNYSGGYYSYSYNETGKENNGSYGRGYKGTSDKRRNGYKYKGGKRLKHGENSTSSEETNYSGGYNTYSYIETGEENNGSYGRGYKGTSDKRRNGYKYKGGKRLKHGENSTSSEDIDYSGGYSSYSYNETGKENGGSYGRGIKGKSDKRRNGYKYKGGKRLKHGENSTSSEQTNYSGGYYSYSYNETGEENIGSYGRGYKGTSDKRRNGYKYKGGKRLKHGENSTSSEDIDYSGGYYSHSYNETGEENGGSYGRGIKGKSDKRRNGYKYKGGKRLKHGENSTNSEQTNYSGGHYSYSYNETGEENNGSYGRGYKGTQDKRRNGYKYKGGKRLKHDENSTSSEQTNYSGGYYSYSYNETGEENNGSYGRGIKGTSDKRRNGYKYKGGKRLKHGGNSTSSDGIDYSGGYYSYSYNETEEENNGSYGRGYNGTLDKRRNGYKYKGGKRLKNGENSTSSEDIDYSGGYNTYSYNGTGEENSGSYGRGIKGKSNKRRNGYKYQNGKRLKHGENSTISEDIDYSGGYYSYSYNETGEENNGSYGRGYKGTSDKRRNGYKYKGGKRLKHGENSTSSEDIDYSGGYNTYSYNETGEENNGSYGRGYKGTSDKRRNGYKYKGGKRLKHGENSTSSEETDYSGGYNTYSYIETGEENNGSYGRGYKGTSDKRRNGYKYKGGKRLKHDENSTSSEDIDYSGGYSSYSYNETGEHNNGSYGHGIKVKSDKRRNGYKYRGGKRLKHGENSTSSEDIDYSGGYYSYSYNGTVEENNGSYGRGIKGKSDKRRSGYKYKGGKSHKHGDNFTSSEAGNSSIGYSYSYNGTIDETIDRDIKGGQEKTYKRNGGKQGLLLGNNKTGSHEDRSKNGVNSLYNKDTDDAKFKKIIKEGSKMYSRQKVGFKYNGRTRGHRKGENATGSEEFDFRSGFSNYNETKTITNESLAQENKIRNGLRYRGRKKGYRIGGNTTSSGDLGSRRGPYSNNGTWNETSNSDATRAFKKLYKHNGHLRNGEKTNSDMANSANAVINSRRGKYRKEGKLRKKNRKAVGLAEGISDEKLDYGSGELSFNGSDVTDSDNVKNGSGSWRERNKGKKYRSGNNKVNGKYRIRKTNEGEVEGVNSNTTEEYYEYYEDDEYKDGAEFNEAQILQNSNTSGSARVKGQKYRTGKHRVGGQGNGTASVSMTNNSTNGADEDYYYTYYETYETYEDSNATESYDLGTEDQGQSMDQVVDRQSNAAPKEEGEEMENASSGGTRDILEQSNAIQLETSSDDGSGYWREEWTEEPTYGEYYTWEKEYEGEEYEVTEQPNS